MNATIVPTGHRGRGHVFGVDSKTTLLKSLTNSTKNSASPASAGGGFREKRNLNPKNVPLLSRDSPREQFLFSFEKFP